MTFAVTSIWQRTLVTSTATAGPGPGTQEPGGAGTQVIELMDTVAGDGVEMLTAENPQTVVKPLTVEQADTFTTPAVMAEVMVRSPLALMEAPTGPLTTVQVTVCDGLLVPMTAAENCRVPVAAPAGLMITLPEGGVTVTLTTVAALEETVTVAEPQTEVVTVEQAVIATEPAETPVTRPAALTVATEA